MEYYMCKFLEYISDFFQTNNTINIDSNTKVRKIEKECVICLEKDTILQPLQHIDTLLVNRSCACQYYVHAKCIRAWSSHNVNDNNNNNHNDTNCLICNSSCKTTITQYQKDDVGFFEMALYFLYSYKF
jgi:hypothetical protein